MRTWIWVGRGQYWHRSGSDELIGGGARTLVGGCMLYRMGTASILVFLRQSFTVVAVPGPGDFWRRFVF